MGGTKILLMGSRSHDQDGRHAIYGKNVKTLQFFFFFFFFFFYFSTLPAQSESCTFSSSLPASKST